MNELKTFTNDEFGSIRTVTINDETYFVGKDVADILGYTNPQKAIRDHVDDEDKTLNELFTVNGTQGTLINESGLYSLIMSSKLPRAKQFKRWVTSDVLPTIRKHGVYATPEKVEEMLSDPDNMIKIFQALKTEREARMAAEQARLAAEEVNRANAPKVLFADTVAQAENDILVGELAKLLKQKGVQTGQNRLYAQLRKDGYIMQDSTVPTQRAMEQGLFRVIERTISQPNGTTRVTMTTKVTGKGQIYFVDKYCRVN